ncbi:hypothetical protein OF83DRAFT_1179191 [Amylostereum chailletii]|nr:hypothetical protein OF83DRAFT_1179191 [Amylostereum chailletii]
MTTPQSSSNSPIYTQNAFYFVNTVHIISYLQPERVGFLPRWSTVGNATPFLTSRNAARVGIANKCTLWKAFASRGWRRELAANHCNDATVPASC